MTFCIDFGLMMGVVDSCRFISKRDKNGNMWKIYQFDKYILAYNSKTLVSGYFTETRPSDQQSFLEFNDGYLLFHRDNGKPASYLDDRGKIKKHYFNGFYIPKAQAKSTQSIEKYLFKKKVKNLN